MKVNFQSKNNSANIIFIYSQSFYHIYKFEQTLPNTKTNIRYVMCSLNVFQALPPWFSMVLSPRFLGFYSMCVSRFFPYLQISTNSVYILSQLLIFLLLQVPINAFFLHIFGSMVSSLPIPLKTTRTSMMSLATAE